MPIDKSDLNDAITRHHQSLCNQSMDVPEWGDGNKPAVIFFDPVTVAERIAFEQKTDDYLVQVIIKKALKPDGSPLFTLADKQTLMTSASAAVVVRVANRILNADLIDPDLLGEFSPTGGKTES